LSQRHASASKVSSPEPERVKKTTSVSAGFIEEGLDYYSEKSKVVNSPGLSQSSSQKLNTGFKRLNVVPTTAPDEEMKDSACDEDSPYGTGYEPVILK